MNEFRTLEQPSGVCVISSYLLDDERIGPTPAHWANWSVPPPTLAEEIFFVLCGSLLGDLMGWTTQQAGKLVHDIVPIKGDEYKQISSASKEPIWWHTEDAFHPYRADYVGLMCLRNSSNTTTTFACIDHLKLDELQLKVLFQPRFIIRRDYSHLSEPASKSLAQRHLPRAQKKTDDAAENEIDKVAVLFGDPSSPYLRLDPYFMDRLENDEEAQFALGDLCRAIDQALSDLILQAGDICFIDNHRVVHGRKPFVAQFDGKDRWLKRILLTRDLRKSRNARRSTISRLIS
jgi:Fe(II)/alpha-ketoglutarate-dependent arginine beta-hydroxylase